MSGARIELALAAGLDYTARFIVGFFTTPILVGGLGEPGFDHAESHRIA